MNPKISFSGGISVPIFASPLGQGLMDMKYFEMVRLLKDFPNVGLCKGNVGTIAAILNEPAQAFEVEFFDGYGRTIALLTLCSDDFRVIFRSERAS